MFGKTIRLKRNITVTTAPMLNLYEVLYAPHGIVPAGVSDKLEGISSLTEICFYKMLTERM